VVIGGRRLRLANRLAPRIEAREEAGGARRVNVDVRVDLPWIGRLIAYHGTVDIVEGDA
jgi:hypothetical protein